MKKKIDSIQILLVFLVLLLAFIFSYGIYQKNKLQSELTQEVVEEIKLADNSCSSKKVGDVNCDGEVKTQDRKILKNKKKRAKLSEQALKNGDIDGDGEITKTDISWIKRLIVLIKKKKTVTITFKDTNEGDKVKTLNAGERLGKLPSAKASNVSNQKFVGWYTSDDIHANKKMAPVKNLTFYPKYIYLQDAKPNIPLFGEITSARYESETLKYWINHASGNAVHNKYGSSNIYLTHIWVKDPSAQIKIAYGGGNKLGNKKPRDLMNSEIKTNSLENKGLVAFNSGFFANSNIDKWGKSQSTRVLIYNGEIVRDDCKEYFGKNKKIFGSYGITKSGEIKFYPTTIQDGRTDPGIGENDYCSTQKNKMIADNIMWSSASSGLIKKNVSSDGDGRTKMMICTVNKNNFVIITAFNWKFPAAAKLAYTYLNCQSLINIDGGSSTTILYKKKTNDLIAPNDNFVTDSALADMIYFYEQ